MSTATVPVTNVATVSGHTIVGVPGRFVIDARANHLVTDSRFGPGESIQAGELLLSALVSCAMANFEANALDQGLPVTGITVEAEHARGVEDPTRYDFTRVAITVRGIDQAAADALGERFVATCPIYNTIRRGGGIELGVVAA
ncbi:OsmC family protein [Rhodococcus artemisiae]|uniref:OsmC family protein n=1 Tax=Rhodococcus artemisiae TaxID=714159 RepID=A0ABU7L6X2_9NOCA|nr:OsmC family protein [Rhodococcus artemisiae]MEE2057285.1 OsmC family protein [Rhodococcus artemisiae]